MPRKSFTSNEGPNAEERALEAFTQAMIDKLNDLKPGTKWEKPWFSDAAMGWPRNMSGREYTSSNALMLKMLCEKNNWQLPVFATFNRLTSLNYQSDKTQGPIPLRDADGKEYPRVMINKGEKSAPVFLTTFTVVNKDTKERIPYEDYRQLDPEEKKDYNVYPKTHVYNVFCVEQTNLKEARPELYAKLLEQNRLEKPKTDREMFSIPEVDAMIDGQKFFCPIKHENKDACFYSISRDIVQLQPKNTFKTGEDYYGTAFHEMTHALGAVGRLDRFTPEKMAKPNFQSDEELVAELSAALISSRKSMQLYVKRDSLPYIKSWLESLQQDPTYIKNVMNDVKKASHMLMNRIDEVKQEMEEGKELSQDKTAEKSEEKQKTQEVAAKSVPEPPKQEQEEEVRRGFHR